MRRYTQFLLQIPLRWKLIGANALLLSAGFAVFVLSPQSTAERVLALALLFIAASANVLLVYLALAPLSAIQAVAEAVTHGDYARRVPPMTLADYETERSRRAFNRLLDHLAADNARIRRLAGDVTRAHELERNAVAHDLREGVAQLLFALTLELGAASRGTGEPLGGARARAAYDIALEAMEDVRGLAGTLTPPALTELGIELALGTLARRAQAAREGRAVRVEVEAAAADPPASVGLTLYRVAERALRNVELHGETGTVSVSLRRRGNEFELAVTDDGSAVDPVSPDPLSAEPGLFGLREMLTQAGGDLRFECVRGLLGTRVAAHIPLPRPASR